MKSLLEFVTPYRRVCGAALMLLVSVLGPNLHFVVAIANDGSAASASLWILLGVYAVFALLPAVRRVSERTSFIVLIAVGFLIALGYGFDTSIKQALARAAGLFDDAAPWAGVPIPDAAQEFTHPVAGYTLRVPPTWKKSPGPMKDAWEFTLERDHEVAAILRPGCDVTEIPLAVLVRELEAQWPTLRRTCSRWHELETCLLRRSSRTPKGERWDWMAHRPGSTRAVRLEFLVYDARAEHDLYEILASVEPAAADFQGPACPTPVQWAAPF